MRIHDTEILDLKIVEMPRHIDQRGAFIRCVCVDAFSVFLGNRVIKQINHSVTMSIGAIRGLHFQSSPKAEMKLVRCLQGSVFDVAVDLRRNSGTFLNWHAEVLTPENTKMMVIPEGFAHGFQVLAPNTQLLYMHTEVYTPELEFGLRFDEPMIGVKWPLSPTDISERDKRHPFLTSSFSGINFLN